MSTRQRPWHGELTTLSMLLIWLAFSVRGIAGAWQSIPFTDCGGALFEPSHLIASFNVDGSKYLNVSVQGDLSNEIVAINPKTSKYTTLFADIEYLQFTVFSQASQFCPSVQSYNASHLTNASCPVGPGPAAFGIQVPLKARYTLTTLSATLRVVDGNVPPSQIACVSFNVTPKITTSLNILFAILPLVILLSVGLASLFAAICNPWTGTTNILRATSNYGQDPDALRLVTPGFADILDYIQFAILTAMLSLSFPGFFQPILSRVSWSGLLFNSTLLNSTHLDWATSTTSFTGRVDPSPPLLINVVDPDAYGLTRYANLVGIQGKDVWPTFMVWFLLIIGFIVILAQIGFLLTWTYKHQIKAKPISDFARLNISFTAGMVIRVYSVFYTFMITLSCYQLVISHESATFQVALAVVVFVLLGIVFPGYVVVKIARYNPRQHLYDDLRLLLCYGPLYNTYREQGVMFHVVVLILRLIQGVVIGAGQASGIAQITLLIIVEIIYLLAVNVWRPYSSRTSMNGFRTVLAVVRMVVILLMVAFVPSLSVGALVREWIAYVILGLHGFVVVFIFGLNALQTVVEVSARLAGAGRDDGKASWRHREFGIGHVFGIKQLTRRNAQHKRRDSSEEQREMTMARDLGLEERGGNGMDYRNSKRLSRQSSKGNGSSNGLFDAGSLVARTSTPPNGSDTRRNSRMSVITVNSPLTPNTSNSIQLPRQGLQDGYFESQGQALPVNLARYSGSGAPVMEPDHSHSESLSSFGSGRPAAFYRAPRERARSKGDMDRMVIHSAGAYTTRDSQTMDQPIAHVLGEQEDDYGSGNRESSLFDTEYSGLESQRSSYKPLTGNASPSGQVSGMSKNVDYAVREADAFYYRRPDYSQPLNPMQPSMRRLGTGPADPTGPVAVARGWADRVFGKFWGRNPDKGKFEVVRPNIGIPMAVPVSQQLQRQQSEPTGDHIAGSSGMEEQGMVDSAGGDRRERAPLVISQADRSVDADSEDDVPGRTPLSSRDPPAIPNLELGVSSIETPIGEFSPTRKVGSEQLSSDLLTGSRPSTADDEPHLRSEVAPNRNMIEGLSVLTSYRDPNNSDHSPIIPNERHNQSTSSISTIGIGQNRLDNITSSTVPNESEARMMDVRRGRGTVMSILPVGMESRESKVEVVDASQRPISVVSEFSLTEMDHSQR